MALGRVKLLFAKTCSTKGTSTSSVALVETVILRIVFASGLTVCELSIVGDLESHSKLTATRDGNSVALRR